MIMQEEAKWDPQKKSAIEFSDQQVQQLQDERKAVQKRTFTRWMNVFLQRCDPPVEVSDLYTDIQDGRILMALLEELSGCKLLYRFRSSSHRIFRLNNISKALAFLDDRHVKLLGIDASSVADGIPSVVLNLVWNIIFYFQVKEVTRAFQRHLSSSLSSLAVSRYPSSTDLSQQPNDIGNYSCSTLPSKGRTTAREPKYHGKAIKTLLQWVQRCTSKFGVEVRDFGKSWRSGMAFLAVIKSINPDLVDLRESLSRGPRENIHQAFVIAHQILDIPPLLEPEDVICASPDEQSIITYVSMFMGHCSGLNKDSTTCSKSPETPDFGSLESVSFGETFSDDPQAQALLKGFEKSREQLLWKRWSRNSSGSNTLPQRSGAVTPILSCTSSDIFSPSQKLSITEQSAGRATTSSFNKKRGRCRSVFQSPSLLDADKVNQDVWLWVEKGLDQCYSWPGVDENHFSFSSEEGIYSVSALDSDEEDAYSYILDLNKEDIQTYNQPKRHAPMVEEETADEMNIESKHPGAFEILNGGGCKHQEGSPVQNADLDQESEARAQSVVHRKFVLDKKETTIREMTNNGAVFDKKPGDKSGRKEEPKGERIVTAQNNGGDYGEEESKKEMTENVRLVTHRYNETEQANQLFTKAGWQKEVEENSEKKISIKYLQVSRKRGVDKEEERSLTFVEVQDRNVGNEKEDNSKQKDGGNQRSVVKLESFEVGLNETGITQKTVYKVRTISATGINTDEEHNRKDNTSKMEDLTKNSKDEKTEEFTNEIMNSVDFESVIAVEDKGSALKAKKNQITDNKATTINQPAESSLDTDTDGSINSHAADGSCTSGSAKSFSEGGFLLHSLAASCDITPFELEMLFVLWILLYCCLILPPMNP
ncbi:uncharacterized protein clmnb [Mastacembelus armatus]|uniref:uncharacterized protein clmnb n=1 Tax=Mastacembelus armatus TaxID=205130 RepID=UPI000E45695A|nr:uncharacterized protein LOC113137388 [Mastacembelus armatus]